MPGPASETQKRPWRYLRNLRGSIGTGRAQPKRMFMPVSMLIIGKSTVPIGSMWGFSRRPPPWGRSLAGPHGGGLKNGKGIT